MTPIVRYRTYSGYLKERYGEKVYKLPVNLPITCPNRLSGGGCSFCADVGTGFEAQDSILPVSEQLRRNRAHIEARYKAHKFIAYFQNYTNTFMPADTLKKVLEEAAGVEDIVEISLSTRPDCISDAYLLLLKELQNKYSINIHLELGLQTANYHTLNKIHRGHGLAEFIDAVLRISRYDFTVCTHLILNLPGDTMEDVVETARLVSVLPVQIVKLHSLYIAANSEFGRQYACGELELCSAEEYLDRVAAFLQYVRPDMVIERLFGRIPEKDALFANWGRSWWKLNDELNALLEQRNIYQGDKCNYMNGSKLSLLDS